MSDDDAPTTSAPGEAARKIRDLLASLGFDDGQINAVVGCYQMESEHLAPVDVKAIGYPQATFRRGKRGES